MSKEDRSIAIIIAIVLVVCTVSLILLANFTWQFLKPNVEMMLGLLGIKNQPVIAINYNFAIPIITPEDISTSVDFNFAVPYEAEIKYDNDLRGEDRTLSTEATQLVTSTDLPEQIVYTLNIPKISTTASVIKSGVPNESMKKGIWMTPGSNNSLSGHIVLFCQSTFFPPTDPRSCWQAEDLEIGDEIFISNMEREVKYRVNHIDTFVAGDIDMFELADRNEQALLIVTNTPGNNTNNRLIILAVPD